MAFGAGGALWFGREAVPNPVTNVLHLVADGAADFFAAGGSEQHSSADADPNTGSKQQHVAQRVVLAFVKALSPVAQIRYPVRSALEFIGNPIPQIAGDAVELFDEISGCKGNYWCR